MQTEIETTTCAICGADVRPEELPKVLWLPTRALQLVQERHPGWQPSEGACPDCVQNAMMEILVAQGEADEQERMEAAGPFNAETAFGVLPTYMRLHSDPRYTGKGVTMAFVDAAFYPHPDLVEPNNRIKAWVNATQEPAEALFFDEETKPEWPGSESGDASQWHGLMTSGVAAGNGHLSSGLYRGLASDAEVVLVQVRGPEGHIGNEHITRALNWLLEHRRQLKLRVVSISVSGDHTGWLAGNPVDKAIARLVDAGVVVVVAAGNAGQRELVPPATAPDALTIGGIDDKNNFDPDSVDVWHSNYGESVLGQQKPELVAPSIWVVAPVLPTSETAAEAMKLFMSRADEATPEIEQRIAEQKFITPHYQHVEGTSFAAPIVASVVACMLEANSALTPRQVRGLLIGTAQLVEGAERERQGAGAVVPAAAVSMALRQKGAPLAGVLTSPQIDRDGVTFCLYEPEANEVYIQGSWNDWAEPGLVAEESQPGVWCAHLDPPSPGEYTYRFVVDGTRVLGDPDNPNKLPNVDGGFDSVLQIEDSAR